METALEQVLMSLNKEGMIAFMAANPEAFEEAVRLAIATKQPYSWRAAWLLWSCMHDNDERIKGYITTIIDSLANKNDGHQRELLKILLRMELSEEQEGTVFNVCVNEWEKVYKKPSVRYTAFMFILKTAKKHPDLAREISFLLEDQYMETLSPGVRKSISLKAKNVIKA